MSKTEKISLMLVIASVCVVIIALQMDYSSVRKLMVMLCGSLHVVILSKYNALEYLTQNTFPFILG